MQRKFAKFWNDREMFMSNIFSIVCEILGSDPAKKLCTEVAGFISFSLLGIDINFEMDGKRRAFDRIKTNISTMRWKSCTEPNLRLRECDGEQDLKYRTLTWKL